MIADNDRRFPWGATVDGPGTFCQSPRWIWRLWQFGKMQTPLIQLWTLEETTPFSPFLPMLDLFDFILLFLQAVAPNFLKCLSRASSERPQFPYLHSSCPITSRFIISTHFPPRLLVLSGNCSSFAFSCFPCDLVFSAFPPNFSLSPFSSPSFNHL